MIENHKDKSKSSQIHHEKTISLPNAHIFPKLFSNTIFSHSFSIENLIFELLPTLLVPQAQIARFMLLEVLELYFINRMEDIQCIFQSMNTKGSIFISNIEAAKNISLLQDKNIRAILSVARSGLIYHTKQQIPYYLYLPIEDREDFQISQYFHETFQFIQRARRQTNVLIHCMVGVSRSVTIAIAYLLRKFRYGLGQVINLIQRKRKKINPNPGFLRQLRKYSQNLGIKCDFHENAIQPFRQTSVSKNKRSLSAGKQKNIGKKQHLSPITAIIVQKQKVVFDGGLSIKDENLSTVKKSVIELRKIKSYQQKGKDNVQQMQGTEQSIQKCQMKKSVSIEEKKGRRRSSIQEKISKIREKILKKEGEKNSKSLFNSPNKEQKQSMYDSYSKTSKLKVQQLSLQLHRTKTPIKQDEQKPFQKQSSNIRPLNDLAKYYQQQRNSHFFTAQLKIQSKSFYSKNSRMNPRFIFRTKQQQQ